MTFIMEINITIYPFKIDFSGSNRIMSAKHIISNRVQKTVNVFSYPPFFKAVYIQFWWGFPYSRKGANCALLFRLNKSRQLAR